MSDAHPVRTHIIGATVASLLVALILWALGFVGTIARGLWSAISWLGHGLATQVSLPTWLVLVAVGYAVAVTVLRRRRAPASGATQMVGGLDRAFRRADLSKPHPTGRRV